MLKSELMQATGLKAKEIELALVKIERADLINGTEDYDIPDDIALGIMEASDRVERKQPAPKLNGSAITLSTEDAIANNDMQYQAVVANVMEVFLDQAIDIGASKAGLIHMVETQAFNATLSHLRTQFAEEHLNREATMLSQTVETLDLAAKLKSKGIDPNGYYGVALNLQSKIQKASQLRDRISSWQK
jgi:hypothetical protein